MDVYTLDGYNRPSLSKDSRNIAKLLFNKALIVTLIKQLTVPSWQNFTARGTGEAEKTVKSRLPACIILAFTDVTLRDSSGLLHPYRLRPID
ncbi:MAG: hypothetical protein Q4P24_17910 [Rhodobacterales bacterium]|nr:hypothetical protein [Rhodobacterales bacterium]